MSEPPALPGDAPEPDVDAVCDECGAGMTWDPESYSLSCDYCGHRVEIPRGKGTILERPLDAAGEAARGFGLEVRVLQCEECGARVALEESATAEACVYCGSTSILPQDANRNAIRPESLVPLDVGKAEVEKRFHEWIRGLWFRPNALKKTKRFTAVGIYVPFWTFDCFVHSDWSAESGTYYYVTETYQTVENGKTVTKTRRVRKTRWRPAWGSRDDAYDDLLVCAAAGVARDLVRKLGDFDTGALVPYRPEYLAGWRAEEYSVDLAEGWETAQADVEATQYSRCGSDVPGDTYRGLEVTNRIRDVRWKHVLLPIWSASYRFRDRSFTVLVHGQTGRVVGEAPLSWVKILLFVLLLAAIVAGAVLLIGALS